MSPRNFLWILARLFVGLVFAYAGWTKLIEPMENFRGVVAQYEVIPYIFVPAIALILPWLEFIFGIFLIVGYTTRLSALILALISLGFVLLITATFFKTGQFPSDCGCFGKGSLIHLTGWQVLLLDCANALLGLGIFKKGIHAWTLDFLLLRASTATSQKA